MFIIWGLILYSKGEHSIHNPTFEGKLSWRKERREGGEMETGAAPSCAFRRFTEDFHVNKLHFFLLICVHEHNVCRLIWAHPELNFITLLIKIVNPIKGSRYLSTLATIGTLWISWKSWQCYLNIIETAYILVKDFKRYSNVKSSLILKT